MLISLVQNSWGPQFIVPTISIERYGGCVLLRETLDEELLKKELEELGIDGHPRRVTNLWYIRRKGVQTWLKVGESYRWEDDFAVRLNTRTFKNGSYQILGFMHVLVKTKDDELTIARQNIADFLIKN
jgi:hypothetical protein